MADRTTSPRSTGTRAPAPRVHRRPDGILEIVPVRPPPRSPWRDAAAVASTTLVTLIVILALAPLAFVVLPLLYLAPAAALPRALRALRRRGPAGRRPLELVAAETPRRRGVGH